MRPSWASPSDEPACLRNRTRWKPIPSPERPKTHLPVNIPDIEELENNIHAGTKYLRFLRNRYFDDPNVEPMQKVLLTFASYNAGPARVTGLRRRAGEMGLDPNRWFDNVEIVAAREIGRETVQYVSNIYKYYIAYTEIAAQLERKGRIP